VYLLLPVCWLTILLICQIQFVLTPLNITTNHHHLDTNTDCGPFPCAAKKHEPNRMDRTTAAARAEQHHSLYMANGNTDFKANYSINHCRLQSRVTHKVDTETTHRRFIMQGN
jgi:hypothetical protein